MQYTSLVQWAISLALPALAGFAGVIAGAMLTALRERHARQLSFRAQQLQLLYGPLLGLRREIQALSELRGRISQEADLIWQELCARRDEYTDEAFQRPMDNYSPKFDAIIKDNNRQLTDVLLPTYKKMLETFRDHLWLAEPETRPHFDHLVEFLNVWDRWQAGALPREVLDRLNHSEESLKPLYAHVETKVRELQGWLATGNVPARRRARIADALPSNLHADDSLTPGPVRPDRR